MGDAQQITDASIATPMDPVRFESMDLAYVNDNTFGARGRIAQLQIDTLGTQLNPNQYICPDLSYLAVTHYLQATSSATAQYCPFAGTLKNAFPHIDSCQVRINNLVITNNQPNLALVNNYQLLRRWSDSKLKIAGATYIYYPPDKDAGMANAVGTATANQCGTIANNNGIPTVANITSGSTATTAFYAVGTAALDGTTGVITGVGTTWTASMSGGTITFQNGVKYPGIGFTTGTTLLVGISAAGADISAQPYRIDYTVPSHALPTAPTLQSSANCRPPRWNSGMYQRMLQMSFPGTYANAASAADTGAVVGGFLAADLQSLRLNQYTFTANQNAAANYTPYIYTIYYPLPILADAFAALGLTRNRIQLQIGFNDITATSGTVTNPLTAGAGSNVCPWIMTPEGLDPNIGGLSALSTGVYAQTRLYLRLVTIPINITLPAVIEREYMDFQIQQQYTNLNRGTQSMQITPGIQRPRMLLLYTFYNPAAMPNGLSQSPPLQLTCEEPAYSSLGTYFGPPSMYITIGTKQAFSNQINYHHEKYTLTDQVNFSGSNNDDIVVSGLAQAMDFRNTLQGGITAINLSRCAIPLSWFDGYQILVNGYLYTNNSSPVDCIWVILFTRITRFLENGKVEVVGG